MGTDGTAELRTGGKINVFLRITGRRDDGYHDLRTLFMPLPEPVDTLRLRPAPGEGFALRCAEPGIDPLRNTLTKAYQRYAEASGFAPALDAELIKGIPHGAGLGGGSADAALLLNWLQSRAPRPLTAGDLTALAARVGADVPFFLNPRPSLAEGVGERLTPCEPDLGDPAVVLLCPDTRIATAWAFKAWDDWNGRIGTPPALLRLPLTADPKADKNHGSCLPRPLCVENDFEPVVFTAWPELARLKARLLREGACAAGLSGSGSSLFGLFREWGTALAAANSLRNGNGAPRGASGYTAHGPFRFGPAAGSDRSNG